MDLQDYQKLGERIKDRGVFVGCNIKKFASSSQEPLHLAQKNGLTPDSKVLEVGSGCCRVSYWFIDYLNHGGFCGIEPDAKMLRAGKEILLSTLEDKKPRFDDNEQFDLSVFNTSFDMIVAYSIWSHAPKRHIEKMIKQLPEHKPCTLLATVRLSGEDEDYMGDVWRGYDQHAPWNAENYDKSFNMVKRTVHHSAKWLETVSVENGCTFDVISEPVQGQSWVRIRTPYPCPVRQAGDELEKEDG